MCIDDETLKNEVEWFRQHVSLPAEELPPALDSRVLLQKAQSMKQERKAPAGKWKLRWAALACSFVLVALVAAGNGLLRGATKGAETLQSAPMERAMEEPQAYALPMEDTKAAAMDFSAYFLEPWEGDWAALQAAYPQLEAPLELDARSEQLCLLHGPESLAALRGAELSLHWESETVLVVEDSHGHSLRLDALNLTPLT